MKAVVVSEFGGPEVLQLADVPVPQPGPRDVLVRTEIAAVNFADVKRRRGEVPAHGSGLGSATTFIPGIEVTGVVADHGTAVTCVRTGERVSALMAAGGYAEYALADDSVVIPVPETMSGTQAGAFPVVALTAYLALVEAARVRPGESLLVTSAAGGVGSVAVQIGRLLGLAVVIGAVGSARKVADVRERGASFVVDYGTADLTAAVREITAGRGVDIVLDARGGAVRAAALSALAPLGRLVHFGNSSDEPEPQWSPSQMRELPGGSLGFSLRRYRQDRPDLIAAAARQLVKWMTAGELVVPVASEMPLDEVAHAHELLETGDVVGKLLLRVSGPRQQS